MNNPEVITEQSITPAKPLPDAAKVVSTPVTRKDYESLKKPADRK